MKQPTQAHRPARPSPALGGSEARQLVLSPTCYLLCWDRIRRGCRELACRESPPQQPQAPSASSKLPLTYLHRKSNASYPHHLQERSLSQPRPERDSLATAELTAGNQSPRLNFKAHHFAGRPRSTTMAEFPAPTCVLKGSDDDVEDRRHDPCCASDGGRSSGVAVQAEIPNHRRLRRSRAGVVSAAVDVSLCDKRGGCAMRRRTCVNHC